MHYIVKKVKDKLSNWKVNYLSKAGRVCLANSTLNAIPKYYMHNIHLPIATLNDLDKIVNNFVGGGTLKAVGRFTSWEMRSFSNQKKKGV